MKEIKPIERFTPQQVSKELKINPSTLRKYSNMISEEFGSEYFNRDVSNYREYTPEDLELLKRIIKTKNTPGCTLENAIKIELSLIGKLDFVATKTPGDTKNNSDQNADIATIQKTNEIIMNQNADITAFLRVVSERLEQKDTLIENQSHRIDELISIQETSLERQNKIAEENEKLQGLVNELLKEINQSKEEAKKGNWFSRLFQQKK